MYLIYFLLFYKKIEFKNLLKSIFIEYEMDTLTQSQSYGFYLENLIKQNVFGLPYCKNDTNKYDISYDKNKLNSNENISIKTCGKMTICCGDILRFYDRDDNHELTIIIVLYTQVNNSKIINEILEVNYSEEFKKILFGSIPLKLLESYVELIKNIPKGKPSTQDKIVYLNIKNELHKKYNMKINISPKVDSAGQRRVQCSIPNINLILEKYPQFLLSRSSNFLRGIEIPTITPSPRRKRKC